MMNKVAFIGCPGAGKSYFANALSGLVNLPVYHLDFIYHDKNFNYPDNRIAWLKAVNKLVNKDKWIIDGNYKSTFELRFPAADTIIYLDYPTYICLWRAFKRRFRYRGGRLRSDMPQGWQERIPWDFFVYILKFRRYDRPNIYAEIDRYKESANILIFKSPRQAHKFLKTLA